MQDLEKEREELIKLMEKHIDPELMKSLAEASRLIVQEKQHEVIVTTEGTINA